MIISDPGDSKEDLGDIFTFIGGVVAMPIDGDVIIGGGGTGNAGTKGAALLLFLDEC